MAEPEDPREEEIPVRPDPEPEPESVPEPVEPAPEPEPEPVPEPEPEPEPEPQPEREPETQPEPVRLEPLDVDDEAIGFCTPTSLHGQARTPAPLFSTSLMDRPRTAAPAAVIPPAEDLPRATRPFARPKPKPEEGVTAEPGSRRALLIYGCLIGSVVTLGLSVIPALYLAWISRQGGEGWTRSHRLSQLRTSIIGTRAGAVGVLTLPVGLGVFLLTATLVWVVVRGSAGLIRLVQHKPLKDPRTWSLP